MKAEDFNGSRGVVSEGNILESSETMDDAVVKKIKEIADRGGNAEDYSSCLPDLLEYLGSQSEFNWTRLDSYGTSVLPPAIKKSSISLGDGYHVELSLIIASDFENQGNNYDQTYKFSIFRDVTALPENNLDAIRGIMQKAMSKLGFHSPSLPEQGGVLYEVFLAQENSPTYNGAEKAPEINNIQFNLTRNSPQISISSVSDILKIAQSIGLIPESNRKTK